jgi:2-polyprenyl-6-hydroxyphenyl methylase/3-demethylubiquinone-9 3-methyltransferase
LKVAQLHALEAGVDNLSYREVAVEDLATERPASFDVVTCMEMLEHVPDPASVVRACAQLVDRAAGCSSRRSTATPRPSCSPSSGPNMCSSCCPRARTSTPASSSPANCPHIRAAGLSVEGFKGMEYNPLSKRYWLSADTSVNYLVACRKSA